MAGALAGRRRPISGTATVGQPTAAVRPLTAADDDNADRPAAAHSTVEPVTWVGTGLQDAVTHDAHWIPIRAVAAALQGHDHHTPQAVKTGASLALCGSSIRRKAARHHEGGEREGEDRAQKMAHWSLRFDVETASAGRREAAAGQSRGQITRLGFEPLADDAGAPFSIFRPVLREAIVDDVVALDAARALHHFGAAA